MREAENHSLSATLLWKCLSILPRPRREHGEQSINQQRAVVTQGSNVQQGQSRGYQIEYRHLPQLRRVLSVMFPSNGTEAKCMEIIGQQTESPFFRLPGEIRRMIYMQLLGDNVFHIVRRRQKLGHIRCRASPYAGQCTSRSCRGLKLPSGVHAGFGDGGIIQILQSCHRA